MPTIAAQTQAFPPNPSAPRWEQMCEVKGRIAGGAERAASMESLNRTMRARGQEGWELVAAPVTVSGGTAHNPNWSELILCFKRPAAR